MGTDAEEELGPYLERIARDLETVQLPHSGAPRLEAWEIQAFRNAAHRGERSAQASSDELYRVAAALRLKIEGEVSELTGARDSGVLEPELARRIEWTLARGKAIDAIFGDLMTEGPFSPDSEEMKQLNRSRLRLIRLFSGLWLLYDEMTRRGSGS